MSLQCSLFLSQNLAKRNTEKKENGDNNISYLFSTLEVAFNIFIGNFSPKKVKQWLNIWDKLNSGSTGKTQEQETKFLFAQ